MGQQAEVACDGTAAVEVAWSFLPDAEVLDIGPAGMSGHDGAGRLREWPETGDTSLVAVTARAKEDHRPRSRGARIDLSLVKPVAPDALPDILVEGSQPIRVTTAAWRSICRRVAGGRREMVLVRSSFRRSAEVPRGLGACTAILPESPPHNDCIDLSSERFYPESNMATTQTIYEMMDHPDGRDSVTVDGGGHLPVGTVCEIHHNPDGSESYGFSIPGSPGHDDGRCRHDGHRFVLEADDRFHLLPNI